MAFDLAIESGCRKMLNIICIVILEILRKLEIQKLTRYKWIMNFIYNYMLVLYKFIQLKLNYYVMNIQ